MECNKGEAEKAKELAEKKFGEKDLIGARKFAMKAQSLFPGLDGLQSLLATLNIYLAAERKVNGEVDWYGVLGVEPSSDDETVKKQYRKLALTLHPDKNKSVGAEGAFKILSEAWSLLSDKVNRNAYDQKRSTRKMYEKVMPQKPSNPVGSGGIHRSVNNGNVNMRSQNAPNPHLKSVPPPKHDTFWTMCTSCKMQFEYVLFYLNKKLECYNCKEPYLAIRIPPPQTNPPQAWLGQLPQDTAGYSGSAGSMPAAASSAAQAMNGIKSEKLREASQVNATLEAALKSKTSALKRNYVGEANGSCFTGKGEKPKRRRRAGEIKMNEDLFTGKSNQVLKGNKSFNMGSNGFQNGITVTEKVNVPGTRFPAISRELSLMETRNMLMAKAKSEICKKLNEWKSTDLKVKASNNVSGARDKAKSKENLSASKTQLKAYANGVKTVIEKPDPIFGLKHYDQNLESYAPFSSKSESEVIEQVSSSMIVPDPDFHDFDKDRTEKSFGGNQVWAAYDDDDGMPRYYAMIHSVISRKPFKMRISWLNSKNTTEFGSLNWVGCGFYKTSGDFRVGKHEINKSVNSFSHTVKWTKGTRGAIRIYPRKGNVWALFRNWSPEWNEQTPDDVIHQYDMVEVVDDYDEDKGAAVIPLVKVAGFKTVFQHKDHEQVKVIPREEMFRFSHQVPAFMLTGKESASAPKGCWELDPAATPVELLNEMTEATDEVSKTSVRKVARDDLSDQKKVDRINVGVSELGKRGDGVNFEVGNAIV